MVLVSSLTAYLTILKSGSVHWKDVCIAYVVMQVHIARVSCILTVLNHFEMHAGSFLRMRTAQSLVITSQCILLTLLSVERLLLDWVGQIQTI